MIEAVNRRTFLLGGAAISSIALAPRYGFARKSLGTIPAYVVPTLSAPLADPLHEGFLVWDPTPLGYVVEERLMSGIAPIYKSITENDYNFAPPSPGTEPVIDPIAAIWGTPQMPAQPDPFDFSNRPILSIAPYTTRIVVYRPSDMSRFSGNVIVETIHHSGGGHEPIFGMTNHFYASRGDIAVCVQHPITLPLIKFRRPERYGSVFTSDYSQIWGMLADAARLLKAGGKPSVVQECARRAYLTGYSFTGLIVTTFAKRHHAVNRLPDGAPVFDGYVAGTGEGPMPPLDVPIFIAANQHSVYRESDIALRRDFDADGPMSRRRRYEVAGYQHTPLPEHEAGSAIPPPRSSETERRCTHQFPEGAVHNPNLVAPPIMEGMFRNISEWVDQGTPAPRAPIIESEAGTPKLDMNGNALGGVRMPEITVPLGSYSTGSADCTLTGWLVPFMQDKLRQLYGNRDAYLRRYAEATDRLVAQRFIVPETGISMKALASDATPAF